MYMKKKKGKNDTIDLSDFLQTEKQTAKRKNTAKPRVSPIQNTAVKIAAFILAIIMMFLATACVCGMIVMKHEAVYTTPKDNFIQRAYSSIANNDMWQIITLVDCDDNPELYCDTRNIYSVKISEKDSKKLVWSYSKSGGANAEKIGDEIISFSGKECYYHPSYKLYGKEGGADDSDDLKEVVYIAQIEVYSEPVYDDEYMLSYNLINLLYSLRYAVYVIAFLSVVCLAVCVAFLICASGHRKGCDKVQEGWGTKVPFDLLTAGLAVLMAALFWALNNMYGFSTMFNAIVVAVIFGLALAVAVLGWVMSFALRIKLGKWWKNTIIFRVLNLIWRGVKALFGLLKNIHLVWKTALIVVGVSLVELIVMSIFYNSLYVVWFVSSVILGLVVLYCAINFNKLQRCAKELASGNLYYQIETEKLHGEFKKHGEALNNIGKGMMIVVDERMKSERMKTELITNVSHDIKTPLTSIINYTDLITKEPCNNEKIKEYSEVLLRQSERLKRLIEDLVEASKASTGNLEVLLAPCEANILLSQAVGEYEEKLCSKGLELITTRKDKPIMIMADGRRLWRVFDNLINNIYKYAQSSTRVYLSLDDDGEQAIITFKNTSHAPLNLSPDELMERFVRGDSSRNTDGNGLGLSIAKSLTELQNGSLEISIDGDLFKVTLRFPLIKP